MQSIDSTSLRSRIKSLVFNTLRVSRQSIDSVALTSRRESFVFNTLRVSRQSIDSVALRSRRESLVFNTLRVSRQSIDSRQLAFKVLRNKDLQCILFRFVIPIVPSPILSSRPFLPQFCHPDRSEAERRDLRFPAVATGHGNCPSTDTNGQERRARRFLPYTTSMLLHTLLVNLRKQARSRGHGEP